MTKEKLQFEGFALAAGSQRITEGLLTDKEGRCYEENYQCPING